MELKDIFNRWAKNTKNAYQKKQWLLSKWEVIEGIEWPPEKIDAMLATIKKGLNLSSADTLIDLGCGGGWILQRLGPSVKKACGLDISQEMLAYARTECPKTTFVCGELAKLPFRSETFSRVLSYFVFINFMDETYVRTSLLEMMRVLKKGGRALIGQLPDKSRSEDYDKAKANYLQHCREKFQFKKDMRDIFLPPIKLFNRQEIIDFLNKEKCRFEICDSFNPFYRPGEPVTVNWRFDIILQK